MSLNLKSTVRHYRKSGRRYSLILQQDLFGEWMLSRYWGSESTCSVSCKHSAYGSYSEALSVLESVEKVRLKRGYVRL